jgi:hypothetical protein
MTRLYRPKDEAVNGVGSPRLLIAWIWVVGSCIANVAFGVIFGSAAPQLPGPLCPRYRTSSARPVRSEKCHDQTLGGYLTARTGGGIHDPSRIDGAFSFGQ